MRVYLRRGKAKPAWWGHPWIYSGAIERVEGEVSPGELAAIFDSSAALIGFGHYNSQASIAVRMWSLAAPGAPADGAGPDIGGLLQLRLQQALQRRRAIGLPSADTNAFRLVNSEGDRLPGLIIDVFDRTAVVLFGTPGAMALGTSLRLMLPALLGEPLSIVFRVSPEAARLETMVPLDPLPTAPGEESCMIREGGRLFWVDTHRGQKTGFYLDQRENRKRFAACVAGRSVLDICSYSGAFAISALAAGATKAVAVDSSAPALQLAQRNAQLNGMERFETVEDDCFSFLRNAVMQDRQYGAIVLDPPKFCRRRSDVDNASDRYVRLNELALRCLTPDGLLATCSCSEHIETGRFLRLVAEAGQRAGKVVHLLAVHGQSPDHPVLAGFEEGRYLTFALCQAASRIE